MNPLLLGIVFLAFLLRIWGLSSYPAGFNADEASFGYDAYSLLKTGKDQWGEPWPLTLRSFGDFKLPVYAYLTIPSVAIFGLNEFAVRLPNAILGSLAVLATYFMVIEIFGRRFSLNKILINADRLALFSALILAISPWHVSLSRGAFEANLTTFFVPLGVWCFFKGIKKPKWMGFAAIVFGVNLFSYHSGRLFTPLLLLVIVWLTRKELVVKDTPIHMGVSRYRWPIFLFALFVILASYTIFTGAGTRGADIAIFNPTDNWQAVSDRRYEAVLQGLPDSIARVFSNKITYTTGQFLNNYLSYFSPQFFFTQGAGESTYGLLPGQGMLYLAEVPFIIFAMWFFVKKPSKEIGFILLWVVLAPIPAALTKGAGLAGNRTATMMPAIQILSAYGGIILFQKITQRWRSLWSKRILLFCYFAILLISLIFFIESYIYHAPKVNAPSMSYGWQETFKYLNAVDSEYKEIIVSRSFSEPQIFVGFYKAWDPNDYQKATKDWLRYKKEKLLFVDQLGEYRLGKYIFRNIHYSADQNLTETLLVGKLRDFPKDTPTLKIVNYPSGEPVILIVDPSRNRYAKIN